jgi:putative nucleotidyltransferase with HDIG domain
MEAQQGLSAIRDYVDKMPSLPTTVSKILEICNDPQTSPADLNRVISLDPVLMGKVMKLINSAYYGISQHITSLVRAIIMLGINTVKNLALSTAVLENLANASDFRALNMEGFWRHSLCVGVTAKLIARKRNVDSKMLEEYFMAGLLHDLGKIPLNNRLSEQYVKAMANSDREQISLYQAERAEIGADHADVGRFIMANWQLGEEITDSVAYHHSADGYEGNKKDIVYTVALSNYLANSLEIGFAGDRYPEKPNEKIFGYLKITMDWLDEIEDTVNAEIEKARIFLRITG